MINRKVMSAIHPQPLMLGMASTLRAAALHVTDRLQAAGHETYWVGGAVRDLLRGVPPKDVDIATSARPDRIEALFRKTYDVGKAFGVICVRTGGRTFEVATFRHDQGYTDGRRPEGVRFTNAEEDARRRDFTVNGLFLDPRTDRLLDFVGGRADLEARVLRAIGDPEERFREDRLRMLRAARFAATLEFRVDPATAEAIRRAARHILEVSAERIRVELTRLLLEAPRPGRGLRMLRDLGLLKAVLPEVDALADQAQPPQFHPEGDVFEHTAIMLDALRKKRTPTLAYAVLLHDVGKPPTAVHSEEPDGSRRWRFNNHAVVGAEMAEAILRRLKAPAREIEDVSNIVRRHMQFIDAPHMRKATLRRWVGAPTFKDELEVHRLDCLASHGQMDNYRFLQAFRRELKAEPVLPQPWVTGRDLLALGLREGPDLGRWLRKAYDAQLASRFNDREAVLRWLRRAARRFAPEAARAAHDRSHRPMG